MNLLEKSLQRQPLEQPNQPTKPQRQSMSALDRYRSSSGSSSSSSPNNNNNNSIIGGQRQQSQQQQQQLSYTSNLQPTGGNSTTTHTLRAGSPSTPAIMRRYSSLPRTPSQLSRRMSFSEAHGPICSPKPNVVLSNFSISPYSERSLQLEE